MAHGYLEDGYGIDGGVNRDRDEDREHRWRDRDHREHGWHDRDRGERSWRAGDDWSDRDRGMMFGDRDRERGRFEDDFGGRRSFSADPDDHYRSWRDRHMSELDRDYADYCREREQQFHSDFDAWRRQRHANYQPLRTGMTNSGMSHDPSGQVQQETEATSTETDPTDAATLGTNTEPAGGGRGRR